MTRTLLDHDGSVDDFVALILAVASPVLDVVAVTVTDGDCYLLPAVDTTKSLLKHLGAGGAVVAASDARGRNVFPETWRQASWQISNLPPMRAARGPRPDTHVGTRHAVEVISEHLLSAPAGSLIATGPLTNIAAALKQLQPPKDRLPEIVWMGGAFAVDGNVQQTARSGTAEWNAYWDPSATQEVLEHGPALTIIPLDVTKLVPLTHEFISDLAAIPTEAARMAALLYSSVQHRYYEAWDLLTVAAKLWPELFTFEVHSVTVEVDGPHEGRTTFASSGTRHRVATDVQAGEVLDRVLTCLAGFETAPAP
jgi:purine nucleosidase